jgi:hypothetical protein
MRGAKYDYKIKYDDISRLFLLPKQDDMHMAFVIALDKPIRQGQQVSEGKFLDESDQSALPLTFTFYTPKQYRGTTC